MRPPSPLNLAALCRLVCVAAVVASFVAAAQDAVEGGQPPATEDVPTQDPGFHALDVLASLKRASDERRAACLNAFGQERFCTCLNGRLTLDLSFDDYIVLVTRPQDDPGYLSLPPEKQALIDEVRTVRDRCAGRDVNR